MTKIKRALTWFLLYNKRLLKKPLFSLLLLVTVICVVLMSSSADGGVVRIALAAKDPADPLYTEIRNSLITDSVVIDYHVFDTPDAAEEAVRHGEADAAWIFADNLSLRITEFVGMLHKRYAFVTVVQREDSVILQLTHETLNGAVYPYLARALYERFLRTEFDTFDDVPTETLLSYYDAVNADGEDLFLFSYVDGSEDVSDIDTHYLLSPLRGLLSVLTVVGGLATSIFYLQDEKAGKFDWLPQRKRFFFSFVYTLTAVFDLVLVSTAALIAAGLSVSIAREILLAVLYVFTVTAFSVWLRVLCRSRRVLGMLLPLIAIAMITLCPVFFSLSIVPFLQQLLPPYLYLNSIHNLNYVPWILALGCFYLLWAYLHERIRERLRVR